MPFIRISLKSLRRKAYDFAPRSVGEHILRHRLKLGLSQGQAATVLGVRSWTVLNWEKGHTEPPTKAYKAIIRFLGYEPYPAPQTLRERLQALRRTEGWSIREAASRIGVDEGTWGSWERAGKVAWPRYRALINRFLKC